MNQGTRDGGRLEISGEGPTVVLVHGLGLNRHMWQWQIPALEQKYRVIRYDLPGHGESAPPPDRVSLSDLADQLARVMDAASVERAALIGFSLGGMIVRRFVMDHPGRTNALCLLNTAHDRTPAEREAIMVRVRQAAADGPAATVEAALARWFSEAFSRARPDVLEQIRGWVTANDPDIYPELYRVLAEGDEEIIDSLSQIDCPTLVMTGEEDFGNSPEMARQMAAGIRNAEAVILPGLRHMALAEDPDRVNGILKRFLHQAIAEAGD